MQCPRDQTELLREGFWKYPRDACPACQGIFVLERDMTEGLGHKEPKKFEAVAAVKLDNLGDSDLKCPRDGTKLKSVHFANAEIDVCPACKGLWLDHGEYEKIVSRMREKADVIRPNPKLKLPEEAQESGGVQMDGVLDVLAVSVRSFWAGVKIARRL